jgi:hypothetical protein
MESREEVEKLVNMYVFGQQFEALIDLIWDLLQENHKLKKSQDLVERKEVT